MGEFLESDFREALPFIPNYDREVRLRVAAALYSIAGDGAEDDFLNWCDGASEVKSHRNMWKWGRKSSKVTASSLFYLAGQSGWKPESRITEAQRMQMMQDAAIARHRREIQARQERESFESKFHYIRKAAKKIQPGFTHLYLQQKWINPGYETSYLKEYNGMLAIFGYHVQKFFTSPTWEPVDVQLINADCEKLFLEGGTGMVGLCHLIKGKGSSNHVSVVEGYATGYAHTLMTGRSSIICFTANNSVEIAKQLAPLRERLGLSVWYVADNDISETGQRAAVQVEPYVDKIVTPQLKGTDAWDDYAAML